MIAIQVARIIAEVAIFFEFCDENVIDPDTACEQMEVLTAGMQGLDRSFLRELVDAFQIIAPEYSGAAQELVRHMARDLYLEEIIAADDPERLAELEAQRDRDDEGATITGPGG